MIARFWCFGRSPGPALWRAATAGPKPNRAGIRRNSNHAEATALIRQLAEWKPPMLILTGGDPLMRRDALDLVREASDAGLHVGLSPSATQRLLQADFAELKAAGVQRMSLSLDGATRETHDSFRGVAGTYDRTIEAVRRAHAVGLSLQINTTLTRGNMSTNTRLSNNSCSS